MLKSLNRNFAKNPKQYILLILVLLSVVIIISYKPMKESMWLFGGGSESESESEDEGLTAAQLAALLAAAGGGAGGDDGAGGGGGGDGDGDGVGGVGNDGTALTGGKSTVAPFTRNLPGQNQSCNTTDDEACGMIGGRAGELPLFCLSTGTETGVNSGVGTTCQTAAQHLDGCVALGLPSFPVDGATSQTFCLPRTTSTADTSMSWTPSTPLGGAYYWKKGNHQTDGCVGVCIQPIRDNHTVAVTESAEHSWRAIEIVKAVGLDPTDDFKWHIRFGKHGYFMQVDGNNQLYANGHGGANASTNVREFVKIADREKDDRWFFKIRKWTSNASFGPDLNGTQYFTIQCKKFPNKLIGVVEVGLVWATSFELQAVTNFNANVATPLNCRFHFEERTADTPPIPDWWTNRQSKAFNDTEWHDVRLWDRGSQGYCAEGGPSSLYRDPPTTNSLTCKDTNNAQTFQIRREFDGMFSMRNTHNKKYCAIKYVSKGFGDFYPMSCTKERWGDDDGQYGHDILFHIFPSNSAVDLDEMWITWGHATNNRQIRGGADTQGTNQRTVAMVPLDYMSQEFGILGDRWAKRAIDAGNTGIIMRMYRAVYGWGGQ
jgi:hypothetical protein